MRDAMRKWFLWLLPAAMVTSAACEPDPGTGDTDVGPDPAGNLSEVPEGEPGAQGAGTVQGFVVLQGRVDHSGAVITLNGTDKVGVSDAAGAYTIEGVPPGTYTVTAALSGFVSATSPPFQVRAEEVTTVPPLTLAEAKGSLSGVALLADRDTHAGIVVSVEGTSFVALTGRSGAWSITEVPVGNYAVRASYAGYEDAVASDQEVLAGQNTTVPTLTLRVVTSSISGTVTLEGATDHSGVDVVATATWDRSITRASSTNAAGAYTIGGVEPGFWNVVASKTNYVSATRDNVYVSATHPTVGIDFTLEYRPAGLPTSLVYISGGSNGGDPDQTGVVSRPLAMPFVVEVQDAYGSPVAGTQVYFQVVESSTDGRMQSGATLVLTDSRGRASDTYVLGRTVGRNHVRAGAVAVPGRFVDFYAWGLPDVPARVLPLGGSDQTGVVGQPLALPLQVVVQDQFDNPTPGVTCTFTPSAGSAVPPSAVTGPTGLAQTSWTLGTTMGAQSLVVTCGGARHTFEATARHGPANRLVKAAGDAQTGINGTTLPNPLVAAVEDTYGNPVGGVTVSFAVTSGSGTLNPSAPQTTGASGRVQTFLTLQSLGTIEVTASAAGLNPVVFRTMSISGAPNTLILVSGGSQSGAAGAPLPAPIVVRVVDNHNNPVSDVTVRFTPGATSGTVGSANPPTAVTGADGRAQTVMTLGSLAGTRAQWLRVTVDGFPGVPALTVYQDPIPDVPASISIVSGDGQTAAYGQTLPAPLVAEVRDRFSNLVSGFSVNWVSPLARCHPKGSAVARATQLIWRAPCARPAAGWRRPPDFEMNPQG